mmetsp:Transcript_40928/g.103715  ORF Transcript_40928/g.103715 Transcript_40928/m.103715 type:complete len:218 (+) Transcript_40928:3893-4546(+)
MAVALPSSWDDASAASSIQPFAASESAVLSRPSSASQAAVSATAPLSEAPAASSARGRGAKALRRLAIRPATGSTSAAGVKDEPSTATPSAPPARRAGALPPSPCTRYSATCSGDSSSSSPGGSSSTSRSSASPGEPGLGSSEPRDTLAGANCPGACALAAASSAASSASSVVSSTAAASTVPMLGTWNWKLSDATARMSTCRVSESTASPSSLHSV